MKELNSESLQELINFFVPDEIGIDRFLKNGKPLIGVYLTEPERVDRFAKKWASPDGQGTTGAVLVNMGNITKNAYIEFSEELTDRFIINIRNDIGYYAAGVCLAHEVGHLVESLKTRQTTDHFAENWAMDRIFELKLPYEERTKFLNEINFEYLYQGLIDDTKDN